MRESQFLAIFLIGMIFLVSSCDTKKEDEMLPIDDCLVENVTYSGQIARIISTHCYACHSAAQDLGNVTLEGYDQLKIYVDNGLLLGVIKHQDGFLQMPKNEPQLIPCNIAKIEEWINLGALND